MRSVFWLGIFPGLSETMLDYVAETIESFVAAQKTGGFIPVLQS
jgi:CDP-6-deoxy-D-xylo-4-hexulose-3-dehydrase